jgi:hypothetical protein
MKCGCLLFAHDGSIDYGSQAVLAARLAIKHLQVPVSLVSDAGTISAIKANFDQLPFEHIIEVPKPDTTNKRTLGSETLDFINGNRNTAWVLTPYERTLIIDTDFLIFSDKLNQYWKLPEDFLICGGMINFREPEEYLVSKYSIPMLWATNIMFSKTAETKILFDLVDYIKQEYKYFAGLYEFDDKQYRNDFAFSVACHILSAYGLDDWHGLLPSPILYKDTDHLIKIDKDHFVFLLEGHRKYLMKSQGQDIHMMNKRDILNNLDSLLELAQ